MNLTPIKVECYSGYKANEHPKCFYWKEERFDIKEIIDRWYQTEHNKEGPPANYFKIATTLNRQYLLKHETKKDQWFLIKGNEN